MHLKKLRTNSSRVKTYGQEALAANMQSALKEGVDLLAKYAEDPMVIGVVVQVARYATTDEGQAGIATDNVANFIDAAAKPLTVSFLRTMSEETDD